MPRKPRAKTVAPPAIDEAKLIGSLDDQWRTPAQIRNRAGLPASGPEVACAFFRNRPESDTQNKDGPRARTSGKPGTVDGDGGKGRITVCL